jgi:hypothetical protein
MSQKRMLPKVADEQTGLGLPTIMDRALAAAHGPSYVHLAVFAIDIDRVYWLDPERTDLPFGWEVFMTEYYLLSRIDVHTPQGRDLLESACSGLMEETPGEPPLGGQLVFAAYDALRRGALPAELSPLFASWRSPPQDLLRSLAELWKNAAVRIVELAGQCLQTELTPPLAPPTVETLRAMQLGTFPESPSQPSDA